MICCMKYECGHWTTPVVGDGLYIALKVGGLKKEKGVFTMNVKNYSPNFLAQYVTKEEDDKNGYTDEEMWAEVVTKALLMLKNGYQYTLFIAQD